METTINKHEKRDYSSPMIVHVKIDDEISLILQSVPPFAPDESLQVQNAQDYFNNDPFKP